MERLIGQNGEAMPEQARSAERPSEEHSDERLDRLVRFGIP